MTHTQSNLLQHLLHLVFPIFWFIKTFFGAEYTPAFCYDYPELTVLAFPNVPLSLIFDSLYEVLSL